MTATQDIFRWCAAKYVLGCIIDFMEEKLTYLFIACVPLTVKTEQLLHKTCDITYH